MPAPELPDDAPKIVLRQGDDLEKIVLQNAKAPIGIKILRAGFEAFHRGFFPYQINEIERAIQPIDPGYEHRLVERLQELCGLVDDPRFAERLSEIMLRDLYAENPHRRDRFSPVTNEVDEGILESLTLSPERREEIEEAFRLKHKINFPLTASIPLLCKILPSEPKSIAYRDKVDVPELIAGSRSLPEKSLILLLGMKYRLIEMDPAVTEVLELSTLLTQAGFYDEAISLCDLSTRDGPIGWASRVCRIDDHMGKIYFAKGDFVRSEMKFGEVVRHGRFRSVSVPYNFHSGILNIASGRINLARELFEACADGFHNDQDRMLFREAARQLCDLLADKSKSSVLLLPEFE